SAFTSIGMASSSTRLSKNQHRPYCLGTPTSDRARPALFGSRRSEHLIRRLGLQLRRLAGSSDFIRRQRIFHCVAFPFFFAGGWRADFRSAPFPFSAIRPRTVRKRRGRHSFAFFPAVNR